MPGFQTPITISQAIERIQRNEYLLPSFQREYVWSAEQVENLFDSLMNDYPISSMLFWKVRGVSKSKYKFYKVLDTYIETHHIHNASVDTNLANDFSAVLDGQQRLTSLYLGICGSYAYHTPRKRWEYSEQNFPTRHLYLNITNVGTKGGGSDENKYKFKFRDDSETKNSDIYIDNNGDKWFKVGKIISLRNDNNGAYFSNILKFQNLNKLTVDEVNIISKLVSVIFDKALINFYEEDTQNPDMAVNIFVRINSGGTKLEFSDILLSIVVASWSKTDARTEIYKLVDAVNNKGFNISHDYILRAFLFLYHTDVKFKISSFDQSFVDLIESKWTNIRDAIMELFDLLKVFGLNSYSLTSNNATLPILYYLYHKNIYKGFSTSTAYGTERSEICKWLFKTLLLRSFGKSADSVLAKSRKAFNSDFTNHVYIDPAIIEFPADRLSKSINQSGLTRQELDELLETQKDNRYTFAILAILYPDLDYKNNDFHLDHLHPASSFKDDGDHEWRIHNSILNLQMLDANENKSKNAMSLEDWVDKEVKSGKDRNSFLERHLIPDVDLSYSNFNDFIEARRDLLINELTNILK